MWFLEIDGSWWTQNMSKDVEYEAFAGQQIKDPKWQNNYSSDYEEISERYPQCSSCLFQGVAIAWASLPLVADLH